MHTWNRTVIHTRDATPISFQPGKCLRPNLLHIGSEKEARVLPNRLVDCEGGILGHGGPVVVENVVASVVSVYASHA
jgi:hypothetical protein